MSRKCVFQKEFLYIRNANNLYKDAAWNLSKRDKGFSGFFCLFFSSNFRFTSYKYVTFGYPKVHRPTYLIVISTDDLAPNRRQILIRKVWYLNTLRPRPNGRHFADDIFKWIFLNENVWISIIISLKFVPRGPINNIPTLVQIMAWRRPGYKPLSEAMVLRLLTHICVTRPQWVNMN